MAWLFFALAFFEENQYFGWNALPKSDAELVCDILIMGFFTIALKIWRKS